MPQERMYKIRVTSGVIINGEGVQPTRDKDGKLDGKGPIVMLKGYDARAVVSAGRGVYVDKRDVVEGPLKAEGSGLVKGK